MFAKQLLHADYDAKVGGRAMDLYCSVNERCAHNLHQKTKIRIKYEGKYTTDTVLFITCVLYTPHSCVDIQLYLKVNTQRHGKYHLKLSKLTLDIKSTFWLLIVTSGWES